MTVTQKPPRIDIDRQIQKKKKDLKLVTPKRLVQSPILSHYPIDETRHDLEKSLFTIYHLFLGLIEEQKK